MQEEKKFSFDEILEKHGLIAAIALVLVWLSSYFAAVCFRPEFLDGSRFIFDILNSGTPPPYYLNARHLFEILHFPFYLLRWIPNSDSLFLAQRLLVNIWIAVLPIFLFLNTIVVILKQNRGYLLSWVILLMAIFLLYASAYHGSMVPESGILGILFLLLSSKDSEKLPPFLYVFSLLLSSLLVTGYEPFVLLLPIGAGLAIRDLIQKKQNLKNWRLQLYLLVGIFMLAYTVNRVFKVAPSFHSGQTGPFTSSLMNWPEAIHSMTLTAILGFALPLIVKNRKWSRWGWKVLIVLFLAFFIHTIDSYGLGFRPFHILSRFYKVIFFFLLGLIFLFYSQEKLKEHCRSLLLWSLFILVIFLVHDGQSTLSYNLWINNLEHLQSKIPGCTLSQTNGFDTYKSMLMQNTFRPTRVSIDCAWDEIPYDLYCQPVKSERGGVSNLYCFEKTNQFPIRFSYDLLVPREFQSK